MARLYARYGFDYRDIDMNILVSNQTDFLFEDDIFLIYKGKTYEDVAAIEYSVNGVFYTAYFGGKNVEFNSSFSDVLSGTATGFLLEVWTGSRWVEYWGLDNFSYSAVNLENAISTVGTSDDYVIVRAVLAGNDTITMSSYADVVRGYGGNDSIMGNGGNDTLYGDAGADTINGNAGADKLTGGAGKDVFVFTAKLGSGNVDTIFGFSHIDDTIRLDDDVFKALGTGRNHTLPASQYKENTSGKATDADDRIIYNKSTGALYYDPDGNGPSAAVKIAVISGGPDAVDHTDFSIVT